MFFAHYLVPHKPFGFDDKCNYKLFGVLNTNWNKKDGGFFIHGDDEIIMKPTDFVVFDPRVPHSASEIFTNEKRLGIDFTVRKK